MEQTPALVMSSSTEMTPVHTPVRDGSPSKEPPTNSTPVNSPRASTLDRPNSPTETIRASTDPSDASSPHTTAERAFQHGLDRGNLEQEVGQVMGTLNSWWGGVKKQSVSALNTFKADLDKTMTQAQADLDHLRNAKIEVVRKGSGRPPDSDAIFNPGGKGKEQEVESPDGPDVAEAPPPPPANAFLNRLTSSTSQLQHSLQSTFQSTIASASSNPALTNSAQLRAQLAENLRLSSATENLQLSMKQAEKMAEEYLRKGDRWVKDAERWMGDAVKVVPPEGEPRQAGMSWDGSDFYAFSTSASPSTLRGKECECFTPRANRMSTLGPAAAGSRKEGLLGRLREDQALLLVDPAGEDETAERREEFRKWVSEDAERESREGREIEEGLVGLVGGVRMALVPEKLTDEQFWQRYFFHKHMIEAEEERRRLLLAATQQSQQEDFSWDDEPEEAPSVLAALAQTTLADTPSLSDTATPKVVEESRMPQAPSVIVTAVTSTSTSPRDSEESYDLVSDQGVRTAKATSSTAEDEDSDWE